ncbi:hypothetical protein C8J56DRAFT_903427 [Mycena floridula]|nr:hypothetical protein C8J56DRAFT_903427 [Mycena floridula]
MQETVIWNISKEFEAQASDLIQRAAVDGELSKRRVNGISPQGPRVKTQTGIWAYLMGVSGPVMPVINPVLRRPRHFKKCAEIKEEIFKKYSSLFFIASALYIAEALLTLLGSPTSYYGRDSGTDSTGSRLPGMATPSTVDFEEDKYSVRIIVSLGLNNRNISVPVLDVYQELLETLFPDASVAYYPGKA